MKVKYAVVIKDMGKSWIGHSPDVTGCSATAASREKCLELFHDAIYFHFAGMIEDGEEIPLPRTPITGDFVEISIPSE